jgi:hypothetical protein
MAIVDGTDQEPALRHQGTGIFHGFHHITRMVQHPPGMDDIKTSLVLADKRFIQYGDYPAQSP